MEQEKNNKGVIALLVVIIVILLALVILLATGIINFKSNATDNSNNQSNGGITENNNKADDNANNNNDNQKSQDNDVNESNYIRQTSVVLVEEPNCTGQHSTSLTAEINSNKNIAIAQDKAAEEIIVGNAKYLYKIGIIACDNVKLYYITEDNGLYVVDRPNTGNPNQKGTKVSSSKIIEFLGEDHRDDGSYLKVLTESKNIEYIKYFTSPDYKSE